MDGKRDSGLSRRTFLYAFVGAASLGVGIGALSCKGKGAPPLPPGVTLVGNRRCPVSGKPVAGSAKAPSFHSDFRGHRIGFMCPNCKHTFDTAPDKQKLAYLNQALRSVGRPTLPPKP